jgi:hypothetical protein
LTLRVSKFYGEGTTEQEIDREVKRRLAIVNHAAEVTGPEALPPRPDIQLGCQANPESPGYEIVSAT